MRARCWHSTGEISMKAGKVIDAALGAATRASGPELRTATSSNAGALFALLPTLLPLIARTARRYPVQAAVFSAGVLLLAAADRRKRRYKYSPYID